jgi:hypothetical protein
VSPADPVESMASECLPRKHYEAFHFTADWYLGNEIEIRPFTDLQNVLTVHFTVSLVG